MSYSKFIMELVSDDNVRGIVKSLYRKSVLSAGAYGIYTSNVFKDRWDTSIVYPVVFSTPYISYYMSKRLYSKLDRRN